MKSNELQASNKSLCTFVYTTLVSTLLWVPGIAQTTFIDRSGSHSDLVENSSGLGISIADFDNDGDDDFLVMNNDLDEPLKLFKNQGSFVFDEVAADVGLDISYKSRMSIWFDADNDGWLDLYLGNSNQSMFFLNNGDGTFSDKSAEAGLQSVAFGVAFMAGDLNGDQWLDIYVANIFEENLLFLNHGDGVFHNHIKNSGAEIGKLNSMGGTLLDYEQDGDLDIYLVYDIHEPNKLFINDGTGNFQDMAPTLGADFSGFGMGVDFADFNHDMRYDLYLSYFHDNALLIQKELGNFEEIAHSAGVNDASMSWGVLCADINNDTHDDIFLVNSLNTSGKNRLFINQGDLTFVDEAQNTILGESTDSYSCAYSDLDEDGQLDLVIVNTDLGGIQVMENQGNNGNWLTMNLVGNDSNKFGVGARVVAKIGDLELIDEITAGSGYSSQNTQRLHFGLGSTEMIDLLTIHWPSGNIDYYENISGNQRLLAVEEESLEPFDVYNYQAALLMESSLGQPTLEVPETTLTDAGYSVARVWNETLLNAIRNDLARPTVHARNLFHISAAMYDAWASYNEDTQTYFLGNTIDGFSIAFDGIDIPEDSQLAQEEAISYAAFHLLNHRFANSPSADIILDEISKVFNVLGFDETYTSADYTSGSPAALGNYIAEKVIEFGLQDGANEQNDYSNTFYQPTNEAFYPLQSGNPGIADPNLWQPLSFDSFIDQSGNEIGGGTPDFLSAEWGSVVPFSLTDDQKTSVKKNGNTYYLYHDPGPPPYLDENDPQISEEYKWNFSLVSIWSSHLDPDDDVEIDISPNSQGNLMTFPTTMEGLRDFYNEIEGGDYGQGYDFNPVTNEPYESQWVKRSNYARVLAEFWADGPDSETPPGHWFTILNYVSDHPLFEKKIEGSGPELSDLEWDIKSYFLLGGAMHDAAIAAWSIKGYYDYIRPISAIRYMAEKGQSSDPSLPNYHINGIQLKEGYIELVETGDPLAGDNDEHVGAVKLLAWKGPHFIENPEIDVAGVDWILGSDWSPYQRSTFVTPPFAGYVSGHSTFSRAAAIVLTHLTGDEYFPGGMSEFAAPQNEFLVFEEGPDQDIVLQWAKYQDAADQCSLSRIWGGIHPPADDVPGRLIGEQVGEDAFSFGIQFFEKQPTSLIQNAEYAPSVYPNPTKKGVTYIKAFFKQHQVLSLVTPTGQLVRAYTINGRHSEQLVELDLSGLPNGIYLLRIADSHTRIIIE